ncbi:MAG: apolipoprotein N-acyltransferase [Candidatus Binataceae bacterium]|nr:apolipoprotein N-acyltransferase [Candidatus Binataceae bacterium]
MRITSNTIIRAALAAASGVALALAFPKFDLNLLAWVAFVPLFYAIDGLTPGVAFAYGWVQGLACYIVSVYWITITLNSFAHLPIAVAVLPMLLLSAILAIYTGAAVWAGVYCSTRTRIPFVIAFPIIWAGIEWLRSFFPIGFPWSYVGYAEYRNLELIQFAEITGVYGVSALVVFFNAVLYSVVFGRHSRRVQTISLGTLTALMVAALAFGAVRIHHFDHAPARGKLRVAMVQGDIPQSIKWDPAFLRSSFEVYLKQSKIAAHENVDLIVWPEAAAAFLFQPTDDYPAQLIEDAQYRTRLLAAARAGGTPILFGAPAYGFQDGQPVFYNRAYLVSAQGRVANYYDKMQLVPFGEYVPLRAVLGYFVQKVAKGFGDMIPGRVQTIFDVKGARLGVLICYESVFPDLTRRAVKHGAEILVNITNDAWYGDSSAPYQMLAMAAMRSVETKVPMIRVANTGISAIILPAGQIVAPTPLFRRTSEVEEVAYRPERTIYTIVGDLFAEICFGLTIAALLFAWLRPTPPQTLETSTIASAAGMIGINGSG